MLELRPHCERCHRALPPDSSEAMICSFECTFCRDCVVDHLAGRCPNCGGNLQPRPIRPPEKLARFPPAGPQQSPAPPVIDGLTLTPVTDAEFPRWGELRARVYGELDPDADHQEMAAIVSHPAWHCWLIQDAGHTVGLLELSLRSIVDGCLGSPVPYIEGLYLEPDARNRGLGTRLLLSLARWCREQGHAELATDAELENVDAQRFYARLGFQEVDRVVIYRLLTR